MSQVFAPISPIAVAQRGGPRQPVRCPRRRSLPALLFLLVALTLALQPAVASAHPLGNFTINRYSGLRFGTDSVRLRYVVDMAEIPTYQERARMDTDRDGEVGAAEQARYLAEQVASIERNVYLTLGGDRIRLAPTARTLEFPPGQGGLQTLRMVIDYEAALPETGATGSGDYRDENFAGRLGWQEIVLRAEPGATIAESTALGQDISHELRGYPQDMLQSPPALTHVTFRLAAGGSGAASNAPLFDLTAVARGNTAIGGRGQDRFAELITVPTFSLGALLLALLAAFGWGALHALTPGHGKTIVAAYLVGSRGTVQHALFLGLTTTITHTAGVFVLGGITLFASRFILPERLYPWLGVLSGALVAILGLTLFRQRLAALIRPAQPARDHAHPHVHAQDHDRLHSHAHDDDDYHHAHIHDPAYIIVQGYAVVAARDDVHVNPVHGVRAAQTVHARDHAHLEASRHAHVHSHAGGHVHSHLPPGADDGPVTWRSLLALGISGGLLPCPSALVLMLSAIALGRVGLGLVLIVAFSLGLAGILTAIGVLFVQAGRLFGSFPQRGRLFQIVPVATALVISAVGIVITVEALWQTGVLPRV